MSAMPQYIQGWEKIWHYALRVFVGLVLFYLVFPILVIIPLSFNASPFFTFTKEMLAFDPDGYSLEWYYDFFNDLNWQAAVKNSAIITVSATLLATFLGTLAALGLAKSYLPYRRVLMALLISPMIVPLIISAAAMYFFYTNIRLQGTYLGVILAHTALATPFVVITVTATLSGFDHSLIRAAASLGANSTTIFFRIIVPIILPGVIAGALFAFITSFDEVVVIYFVGSYQQHTIPWQMFSGIRERISPTILAVATMLIIVSMLLLCTLECIRRRNERMRRGQL
ncbi:MAG: ABC transporter permease [Proteobacteria bacterium]|nr:ABC transporter permease [Pseudomonadota bacterium]